MASLALSAASSPEEALPSRLMTCVQIFCTWINDSTMVETYQAFVLPLNTVYRELLSHDLLCSPSGLPSA